MLTRELPFRVIVPGRTYRADHDATHSPMFHQCEGLALGRNLTLGPPQGLPDRLPARLLRRLRSPGPLPLVLLPLHRALDGGRHRLEPQNRRDRGGTDWLEILGSGMVQPKVLANCGIDPREWQGFAFGMGIERVTMLKYGMPDLRPFYESDLRWLRPTASTRWRRTPCMRPRHEILPLLAAHTPRHHRHTV